MARRDRPENLRARREARGELPENIAPHEIQDLAENADKGLIGEYPFLVKRYLDGDFEIHVHTWLCPRRGGDVSRYCAVFKREEEEGDRLRGRPGGANPEADSLTTYQDNASVLVFVRDGTQDREGFASGIRSVVGLQPFDDCLLVRSDSADLVDGTIGTRIPIGPIAGVNGESSLASRALPVAERESPDKVVQRGAQVVGDLAYNYWPMGWRGAPDPYKHISRFGVELGDTYIRISRLEIPGFNIKSIQMQLLTL